MVVLTAMLCMIFWRYAIGARSSRYWAAVPIIALPLLSYAVNNLGFGRFFSKGVAIIIFIAFCLKDIRFNYLQRGIRDAAQVIAADSKRYGRAFCADFNDSGIITRIGYYSKLSVVSYPLGTRLEILRQSATGLYDVCYIVVSEKSSRGEHTVSRILEAAGAEQVFQQYRNMHKKKLIRIYKLPIPQQKKMLPITGEIWKNGGFEKISWHKNLNADFPDGYYNEKSAVVLTKESAISGKYSLLCKNIGESFVYSPLVPPPKDDCTILFSIAKAPLARVKFDIWKFDRNGRLISRELLLNVVVPNDDRLHQFQIPYRAEIFKDAAQIRGYWHFSAPYGLLLDDIGIYHQNSKGHK